MRHRIKRGKVEEAYDLYVCFDTSTIERLGTYGKIFINNKNIIRIDHHAGPFGMEILSYVNSKRGSTCEIIFDILKKLKTEINVDVANGLIAGILTDTGHLMHDNANIKTYKACVELIKLGANREHISESLFKEVPINLLKFRAHIISKIEIINNNLAFALVTLKDCRLFNVTPTDNEGSIDSLINLKNIKYAVFVYESMPRHFNISLRGKIGYEVLDFAISLGGGGHKLAAGAGMDGSASQVREKIITAIKANFK